ncbi:MAG: T9SS type A sorting domain-containing protein [Melioribacteraceae bacterium]|nr:T9SS type A sorting domain-containing protein [Melioribacteraceae bacterium]
MKNLIIKILVLFTALAFFNSFASTVGIATGNKTVDGRPLLFKNKDQTDNYPEDVNYYNGGYDYYSYVFQQEDGQNHTRARMGINNVGFGIVYSDSENLKGASSGPYGSQLTAIALKTCSTINDFRELLNDTNNERKAHNHFAIIDSTGKGAMFEVDGFSYIEIPIIDSIGVMANTAKFHPNRTAPSSGSTSPQREARALYLLSHAPAEGLDYKYFTDEIIKDFSKTQQDEDNMPVGQYSTNPVLSRYKTSIGGVIKGVLPNDNVLVESAMWLCLSEPSLTIALPFFTNVTSIPSFIRSNSSGDGMAGSSDRVRRLVYNYSGGRYSDRYADTYDLLRIREHTFRIQDSLLNSYKKNLPIWIEQSPEVAADNMKIWMDDIHFWAKSKYDSLIVILDINEIKSEIKKTYNLKQNYPNPFNSTTRIKYTIPNDVDGTSSNVKLTVYDTLGKLVAVLLNREQRAGEYEVSFNATSLASGNFFYKLEVAGIVESKKMIYLK